MNEFLEQFLLESRELAEQATAGLLALERAPRDAQQLDEVFRALHTLKGGAGIVDFLAMERAVHAAEDVLTEARAGRRVLDAAAVGACLACVDQVLQWLDVIEATGDLPDAGCVAQADRIIARFGIAGAVDARSDNTPTLAGSADALDPVVRDVLLAQLALVRDTTAPAPGRLGSVAITASNALLHAGREAEAQLFAGLSAATAGEELSGALDAALQRVLAAASPPDPAAADPVAAEPVPLRSDAARTVRIDAERIDALVRLTGELTVAKNSLAHLARLAGSDGNPLAAALKDRHGVFEQLVGELQRSVLTLRVLPLRVAFQRFPRLLREMSETLGKPVQLALAGEDTEADKAIVEMLFEPLLHVVRNAVDHGVEEPAQRAARGKPREATISMRAERRGDQVVVEVADDGAGLDVERIRAVATQRGIAPQDVLAAMTEAEVHDLVFAPGFSTAAAVTALSGRGVGMDAVRTAVERMAGRVSIRSRPGLGTTVTFMLPFSVMMSTVMGVEAGGQVFGVPLDAVIETLRVPRDRLRDVGAARALVVRGQTVPVVDLAALLGKARTAPLATQATLVVTAFAGQRCALEVDALGERLDVILKPLDGLLAGTPGIAGTTLLGDGRVLLVLDVAELLQ